MPVVTIGGRKVFVVPELPIMKTHERIYIDGNKGFNIINGVVSGSGKSTDPYIIEDWDINASSGQNGIEIRNTDAYFIIRNCIIHSKDGVGEFSVMLVKVENGTIKNITCNDFDSGIVFSEATHNRVSGCNVSTRQGADSRVIWLYISPFNIIENCDSHNKNEEIYLYVSDNVEIINCPNFKVVKKS